MLQYYFCFMFWSSGQEACRILAPLPGMEPTPSALEGEVLATGPPGKFPNRVLVPPLCVPALWRCRAPLDPFQITLFSSIIVTVIYGYNVYVKKIS